MPTRFVIARVGRHLSVFVTVLLLSGCQPASKGDAPPAEPANDATDAGDFDPDAAPETQPQGPTPELLIEGGRGLWVLAEGSQRVLEDRAKIERLVTEASTLAATDLFVQVYRGGRAWYDAQLADRGPYDALLERNGLDTLDLLLERAHASGLRVHAWVNVLSLSHNTDAPILQIVGRDGVLVDRHGRSMLDYPNLEVPPPDGNYYRMGTRGVYLDPGAPGVRERLVATFAELLARYPGLDGLHLDYIRHPGALPFVPGSRFGVGLDFGYGAATRERFRHETGLAGPFLGADQPDAGHIAYANEWDDWRRAQVTALVAEIRSACLALRPGLILSAAVNSYVDRAYLSLAQDWKRWLEEGLIDLAIPMVYTLDDRLFGYQVQHFASAPGRERIWPGIGVWLFARHPQAALDQIGISRSAGAPGDVLFSYDSIVDSPALWAALVAAASPDADPVTVETP
ncbi:MAG: family 10 glycosylhydrolase [Deltaproteobacteria bacterium]|nr:family 10 glycosylhydrolase [Deltaproteobacteria bacterium]